MPAPTPDSIVQQEPTRLAAPHIAFACPNAWVDRNACAPKTADPGDGPAVTRVAGNAARPGEIVIAINTKNPSETSAAHTTQAKAVAFGIAYLRVSHDWGATWQRVDMPFVPTPEPLPLVGREYSFVQEVAFSPSGEMFLAGTVTRAYEQPEDPVDGLGVDLFHPATYAFVARSPDLGKTWTEARALEPAGSAYDGHIAFTPAGPIVYWPDQNQTLAYTDAQDSDGVIRRGRPCNWPGNAVVLGNTTFIACYLGEYSLNVDVIRVDGSTQTVGQLQLQPGGSFVQVTYKLLGHGTRLVLVADQDSLNVGQHPSYSLSDDMGKNWTAWRRLDSDCKACYEEPAAAWAQGAALDGAGRLHVILENYALSNLLTPDAARLAPDLAFVHRTFDPNRGVALEEQRFLTANYAQYNLPLAGIVSGGGGFQALYLGQGRGVYAVNCWNMGYVQGIYSWSI